MVSHHPAELRENRHCYWEYILVVKEEDFRYLHFNLPLLFI